MTTTLASIETMALKPAGLHVTSCQQDAESEGYDGFNLVCNQTVFIKFRQANITPKKAGNFVALWKRAASGETVPFDLADPFGFYLIAVQSGTRSGFFFFPKQALARNGVLTAGTKEGKRGFRLYPGWVDAPNKQALKTQRLQSDFFIDLDMENVAGRLLQILGANE